MISQTFEGSPAAGWRDPNPSGKYGGASRLTLALLLACPGLFVASFVPITVAGLASKNTMLITVFGGMAMLVLLAAILVIPAAVASFVHDRLRLPEVRKIAALEAAKRAHDARDAIDVKVQAARRALAEVYSRHHEALVAEARRLLEPDRYGRRDAEAAALEFGQFQSQIASSELESKGHPANLVRKAFEVDRSDLLRTVLRSI